MLIRKVLLSLLITMLFVYSSALAQSRANDYIRQDSSRFRVVFCPEDAGVIPQFWQTLRERVPTVELQLGLSFRDTATFVITPTEREWFRVTQGVPLWANGIAYPERGVAILKSPRFSIQYGPLANTAIHEYVHLLLQSGNVDAEYPRWFDEGLCEVVAGQMSFMDHTLIGRAVTAGRVHTFWQIQHLMAMPQQEAQLGYAESAIAVQYLIERFGWSGVGNLVHTLRQDVPFEEAFARTYGLSLVTFEQEYQAFLRQTYKLSWLSDTEIWVSALFVIAVFAAGFAAWRRRKRKLKEWEEEHTTPHVTVSGDVPYVINYEIVRSRKADEEESGEPKSPDGSDEEKP